MRTLSIRTLAALAYERGEEFDPAAAPPPALVEDLSAVSAAGAIVAGPAPHERLRLRERRQVHSVPDWFSPCDLVGSPVAGVDGPVVHGEPV